VGDHLGVVRGLEPEAVFVDGHVDLNRGERVVDLVVGGLDQLQSAR